MIENMPRQSADPSLLKCGREHDAIHGLQPGSGELCEQSMGTEQCQSSVRIRVLPIDSFNMIIN